jgi:hypothetical protein
MMSEQLEENQYVEIKGSSKRFIYFVLYPGHFKFIGLVFAQHFLTEDEPQIDPIEEKIPLDLFYYHITILICWLMLQFFKKLGMLLSMLIMWQASTSKLIDTSFLI